MSGVGSLRWNQASLHDVTHLTRLSLDRVFVLDIHVIDAATIHV